MDIYNKEGPKLIQKSYEPLSNQKNLQDLEEKLKIFKKEYCYFIMEYIPGGNIYFNGLS